MLHKMDRWSSRGHALENLESSGTKIMMSGPIVYTLVMRMKQEIQVVVFVLPAYHHSEEFKARVWSLFGANTR